MINRRDFLRAAGAAALALPLARLHAQTAAAPLRLILWPMMNGAVINSFNPQNFSALSVITDPLMAHKNRLLFVQGMGIEGSHDHYAVRSIFSGAPISDYNQADPLVKSLDQLAADKIAATAPTRLRSLHLGAIPADNITLYKQYGRSTLFFNNSGALDYEANPVAAFDRTFAGATTQPAPAPTDITPELENAVLDLTEAELQDVAARVAAVPREASKIALHQSAVKGLRRMPATGTVPITTTCSTSTLASVEKLRPSMLNNPGAAYNYSAFSDIFDAQIDILARAVTCGVTRVATLQAASADGPQTVPIGPGYPHHPTSHGDEATFSQCQRWYSTKLKRLLDGLNVPDPLDAGRTVLDNSVVLVLAECVPNGHGSDNVPCLIAGGGGGKLKGGTMINVAGATNKALLKALATRLFGVSDAQSAHFGSTSMTEVLL
jgi:hypothetical protein